jgi:hypothetical protein
MELAEQLAEEARLEKEQQLKNDEELARQIMSQQSPNREGSSL